MSQNDDFMQKFDFKIVVFGFYRVPFGYFFEIRISKKSRTQTEVISEWEILGSNQ